MSPTLCAARALSPSGCHNSTRWRWPCVELFHGFQPHRLLESSRVSANSVPALWPVSFSFAHLNPNSIFRSPAIKKASCSTRTTFMENPSSSLHEFLVCLEVLCRARGIDADDHQLIRAERLYIFLRISMISVHHKFRLTEGEWWTQIYFCKKQNLTNSKFPHLRDVVSPRLMGK